MNNLKNSVRLIGNLGATPEIRELPSGKKMAKIAVATTDKYKDGEGKVVNETHWHQLIAWGKMVDYIAKYLDKGHEVAVEGKLVHRSYTDKEGIKRYVSEINVSEISKTGGASQKTVER
ncbi:MAG: single-stranded DNA-binding protein [Bacteroidia bacterium]